MNFKVKKISKKDKKVKKEKVVDPEPGIKNHLSKHGHKYKVSLPIAISLGIILVLLFGIYQAVRNIDFKFFLKVAGEELQTDGFGHSNFLILGTGGENHDGGDLTDSIIVASLDLESKQVSMLSIPRDLYIEDSVVGSSRINEVYYNAKNHYNDSSSEALKHYQKKIEELVGIPIHYWIKVDFQGFTDLVDALGGIDVTVEAAIYDPYYPLDGTYEYQTFSIAAGPQHLDGATALKYARSRKTTSDFDRAKRQQQIMYAIKEKALSTKVIFSKEKIENILTALKDNIETNLRIKEMLTLGAFADEFSRDQVSQKLLHDNPIDCGGFLYTPARDAYGGAFVLIPAGGPEFIQLYATLLFNYPEAAREETVIHVLNGTKSAGAAGETKQILQRFCFDVNRYGNGTSQSIEKTTYYYQQKFGENGEAVDSRPAALNFLQIIIPGEETTVIPQEYQSYLGLNKANIILELGSDYANTNAYIEDPFYYLVDLNPTTTEEETDATTE